MLERIRFRSWWQVPRRANTEDEEERTVSFLELFYDLVYVAIIAQLSHALAAHVSFADMGIFVFLFAIVWWAWLNGTMYHDFHGNNDIRTRIFTFMQMFTVAAMAVFAHNAMGDGSTGFALSFAAFQLILCYLWWRTGVHDPDHRPLSVPYTIVFLLTTILFVVSIFVPAPWRFYIWVIAIVLDLVVPQLNLLRSDERVRREVSLIRITPSAVERFGLFTIIVLGEVIIGVVNGLAEHHHLTWEAGIIAALGMMIAFGLWWVYFDFASRRDPKQTMGSMMSWMFLHLPVATGITATGAAILNVVEHAGEPLPGDVRWLLVGAVGITLICIAMIIQTIDYRATIRPYVMRGSYLLIVFGLLTAGLGFTQLNTIAMLVALVAMLLTPVLYGVLVWIKFVDAQSMQDTPNE